MIYEFRCDSCGETIDRQLPVDRRHDTFPCQSCGEGTSSYRFNAVNVGIVFRGFGWPSHDSRASKSMLDGQSIARQKQRDHVQPTRLVPNFQGKEAPSWRDARDGAIEHNQKNPDRPVDVSTFDSYVAEEASSAASS